MGIFVPLSRILPVPTASTMPSWGFSLAVSGSTIPDLVLSSFSTGFTTTRSPSGFRFMNALLRFLKMWLAVVPKERLALQGNECQFYYPPGRGVQTPLLASPRGGEGLSDLLQDLSCLL